MDSFFAKNRLSAYLDGDLPEAEAREVATALESNPELKSEYDELRAAVDLLNKHGRAEPSPDFHSNVMAKVALEPAQRPYLRLLGPLRHFRIEAVALAAAAAVVLIFIQGGEPDATPTTPTVDVQPEIKAEPSKLPKNEPSREIPEDAATAANSDARQPPDANPQPKKEALKTLPDQADTLTPGQKTVTPPDEPFVADWERQPEAGEDTIGSAGSVLGNGVDLKTTQEYSLKTDDSSALFKFSELAAGLGGSLRGTPVRLLTADEPPLDVQLWIPTENAGTARTQLKRLGATSTMEPGTQATFQGSTTIFVVSVHYEG